MLINPTAITKRIKPKRKSMAYIMFLDKLVDGIVEYSVNKSLMKTLKPEDLPEVKL